MQTPTLDDPRRAEPLTALVEATLRELQPGRTELPPVGPDSRLDADLGLDSLARVELLVRAERAFGVQLPPQALQEVETVSQLMRAVDEAATAPGAAAPPLRAEPAIVHVAAAAAVVVPDRATTLIEALDAHAQARPERTQHIVLHDDGQEQPVSLGALRRAAAATAAGLQRHGILPRQCVAIMLPTSAEYFAVYLGILMAGAVPVPIYPPARPSQLEDHVRRHTGILANAAAVAMVTVPAAMGVARLLEAGVPALRRVLTPPQLAADGGQPQPVALRGDDIAFIQYTSGSTGAPKGVVLTHANLLANIRAMAQVVKATPDDVFVSWLPLYHDMGLIGAWLSSLLVGFPLAVMSPLAFLARPLRWLQAIQRFRGTLSAGPNFAYELCLRRIADDELAGLDLSSWRLAFNGAEAVSPDTVRRFSQRFAACGLRPQTMAPVYGLAESAVGLLLPPPGRVAPVDAVAREPLAREGRALPAAADDATALHFVACGSPLPGHEVRLLDAAGREVGERVEGRLEFRGPSATRGYLHNPAQTSRLIHDGWLDSGDRAYRVGADYFITGRVKDIVIRGGRNLYPQEIEDAVGAVPGVRRGCVAVFGSPDPATGTERLVVMAETRAAAAERAALRDAVTRAVQAAIGEPPDEVVLAPPHAVLKTSSGQVRRSACRERYEAGEAEAPLPAAWRQVLRLMAAAARDRAVALARIPPRLAYLAWTAPLLVLLAVPVWIASALLRRVDAVWALSRGAARLLLRAGAMPLAVHGLERLPTGPCVLVANHASYLDGLVLVAALPRPFAFVAKRELEPQWIAGTYLRRLGAFFVERQDATRSVADATRLADEVAAGRSLLVFPEGTFVAAPGLLPFHLGGFLAAHRAGVPVVPLALRGTRDALPDGRWWPRRARLAVTVCAPLPLPADAVDGFAAAVRLRDAARGAIEAALGGVG